MCSTFLCSGESLPSLSLVLALPLCASRIPSNFAEPRYLISPGLPGIRVGSVFSSGAKVTGSGMTYTGSAFYLTLTDGSF